MSLTVVRPAPEPLLRNVVGRVLRARRTSLGRTLRDVSRESAVSLAYLSEIERGRKEASSEVLAAVCEALDLRLLDLVNAAQEGLRPIESRPVRTDRPTGTLAMAA